ncbi:AWPM-19-like family protein, partial [Zea mays]
MMKPMLPPTPTLVATSASLAVPSAPRTTPTPTASARSSSSMAATTTNPGRAAGPRAVSCELAYPCMHVWWCRSLVLPFSVLVFRLVENKQFKLSLISCMSCVRFSVYASYILWSYVCVDMLVSLSMCVCLFVCVSISVCKGRFGKFYLILIL